MSAAGRKDRSSNTYCVVIGQHKNDVWDSRLHDRGWYIEAEDGLTVREMAFLCSCQHVASHGASHVRTLNGQISDDSPQWSPLQFLHKNGAGTW